MNLKDKVVIVTGAARGIGEAVALKFTKKEAKVVLVDIDKESIDALVKKLNSMGGDALGIKVDVTKKEAVEGMVEKVVEKFGKIDVIINNAGITSDAKLVKMTEDQFDKVIDVNLKGTYNCAQAVAQVMEAQGYGVILNASSVVGIYGNFGQTNYAATKWGVIGMTKSWAKELGKKGIRVNAVAPGFILTPMTEKMPEKVLDMMKKKAPINRLGLPEDIANAYAFLASDEASFITGTVLSVDGGLVL
ncbi:MAG: 3-oxoacyl-ACP reductase FabG [Clostridiales bacterium]|nr:3-oxoacyl-ACP reductase FabG [Clostridiales bacterium]